MAKKRKPPKRRARMSRWFNFAPGDPTAVGVLSDDPIPDIEAGRLIPLGTHEGGDVWLCWVQHLGAFKAEHPDCRVLSQEELNVRLVDRWGEAPVEPGIPRWKQEANEAMLDMARDGKLLIYLDHRDHTILKLVPEGQDYEEALAAALREKPGSLSLTLKEASYYLDRNARDPSP